MQLLAGEFLYIASETLSRFLIESRASAQGMTPKNLARLEKANGEKALRQRYLAQEIFAGDIEALEAMQQASDGFEHGFMAVQDVRGLLEPVLERSMAHVRRALIALSGLEGEDAERLLDDGYASPRGLVPAIVMVRGQLARKDEALPPEPMEGAPVELDWQPLKIEATKSPEGEVSLSFPAQAKVTKLPPNVELTLSGFGLRVAHVRWTKQRRVDVEVTRADGTTELIRADGTTERVEPDP